MSDDPRTMMVCGRCHGHLEHTSRTYDDGVTWTTYFCPEHGTQATFADAGELDLGIIRSSDPERTNQFQFFSENFIDHVDTRLPRPSTSRVDEADRPSWVWLLMMVVVIGAAILAVALWPDSRDDSGSQILTSVTAATTPPTVFQITNLPPALTHPAATAQATRTEPQIQITEPPPPPFDPVGYVNTLTYCWQCPAPAMEAYRTVAAFYGWDAATINGRAEFVQRIMAGESAFCWNARRWTTGTALLMPCGEINPGVHDDAGFGQITSVLRPLTCEKADICTLQATVASPWNSMAAYVVVVDELGRRPWCYNNNTHVRNGDCAAWPG